MSKFIGPITTSGNTTVLLSASEYSIQSATNPTGSNNASIDKILIANSSTHTDGATVEIFIYETAGDNTTFHVIKNLVIPPGVTFVWDEPFSFDVSKHDLKLINTGQSPNITIIIN